MYGQAVLPMKEIGQKTECMEVEHIATLRIKQGIN